VIDLIVPCEIAVKSTVPAVKALLAKELVEKHKLRQDETAEILGISQSAVSKYTRNLRGSVIEINDFKEVSDLVDKMIMILMSEKRAYQKTEFMNSFCEACRVVRKARLMCKFCLKTDPTFDAEKCDFCL
jgi:uncharacterized protein